MAKDSFDDDSHAIDLLADRDGPAVDLLAEPEVTGLRGVVQDIGTGVGRVPETLGHVVKELPGEAAGAVSQIFDDPGRAGLNILAGTAELGRGIANIPHVSAEYLAKKGFIDPEIAAKIPA